MSNVITERRAHALLTYERATIADAVPRRKDRKHPPEHLLLHVRAAFLHTVATECPEALADFEERLFLPLVELLPAQELVTLLTRRSAALRVHASQRRCHGVRMWTNMLHRTNVV